MEALYEVVPGISYFRAPSQVIFLAGFSVATLAALGVDRLLQVADPSGEDEAWSAVWRVLLGGVAVTGVLLLLAGSGMLTGLWTAVMYRDVLPERLAVMQAHEPAILTGAGIAFLLAVSTAAIAWTLRTGRIPVAAAVTGIVVLVTVDGVRIDQPFIQVMDFYSWAEPDGHVRAIREIEGEGNEPFRMLSLVQNQQDVHPSIHGIELVAGHHPNDLNRYRELIGMVGSASAANLNNGNIRRLLNVRYILWPDYERGPAPEVAPVSQLQFPGGRIHSTLLADNGLPRARLLTSFVVKNDDEAVPYMLSDAFDPEAEVVLSEPPPVELDGEPVRGGVAWLERTPDRLRLTTSSDRPALLVIADNWFPAWRATVDGSEVPVLRAYHALRAVPVPSGEHTVEMTYESGTVAASLWVSILLFLAVAGSGAVDMWRGRAREPAP